MNPKTQDKINELVDLFASSLKVECERLYRSGAVDADSYDPDHYTLPRDPSDSGNSTLQGRLRTFPSRQGKQKHC